MKKIILFVLLSCSTLAVSAQGFDPRFFNNQFTTFGGGLTMYNNDRALNTGYNGEFSIGNWILSDMALRFSFGVMSAENAKQLNSTFINGHCDFMWDVMTTITRIYDADRAFSVYPMAGFGFLYRPTITADTNTYRFDADFMAMLGVNFEYRMPFMKKWPLFFEVKYFFLPQDYDFNSKNASLIDLTLGLKHEINYDPVHKRLPGESRNWSCDWFLGVAAGPNFSIAGLESPEVSTMERFGWNADITFGRNFSSLWSVRLGLGIMSGTTEKVWKEGFDAQTYNYTFFNLRTDLMFNISNINGFRRGRRFNVLPYAGAGLIERFDASSLVMGADAGLMARLYLTSSFDIYADARYILVPPRFNWGNGMMDNGYTLVNFGFIYNFEPSTCRYAKAAFRLKN